MTSQHHRLPPQSSILLPLPVNHFFSPLKLSLSPLSLSFSLLPSSSISLFLNPPSFLIPFVCVYLFPFSSSLIASLLLLSSPLIPFFVLSFTFYLSLSPFFVHPSSFIFPHPHLRRPLPFFSSLSHFFVHPFPFYLPSSPSPPSPSLFSPPHPPSSFTLPPSPSFSSASRQGVRSVTSDLTPM